MVCKEASLRVLFLNHHAKRGSDAHAATEKNGQRPCLRVCGQYHRQGRKGILGLDAVYCYRLCLLYERGLEWPARFYLE